MLEEMKTGKQSISIPATPPPFSALSAQLVESNSRDAKKLTEKSRVPNEVGGHREPTAPPLSAELDDSTKWFDKRSNGYPKGGLGFLLF